MDNRGNLDRIEIILCDTQDGANIGSVCRAMKTMGLTHLTLVTRTQAKPAHQERKAQAKPVLENATSFYINIGKISKGSAHDMVSFICEKSGLSPEDIVSVAYKQNYSFVYIRNEPWPRS